MTATIYRVYISYEVKNKNRNIKSIIKDTLETFVTTDNIEEIKDNIEIKTRICYLHKQNINDVKIIITDIQIQK